MFFNNFGKINYKIDEDNNTILIQDIISTNMVLHNQVDKLFVYKTYDVIGLETPESISYKLYGKIDYYWTILLINDLINPFNLWANNDPVQYCTLKYGEPYDTHHYFNVDTNRIVDDYDTNRYKNMAGDDLPLHIRPVSNLEYETEKRKDINTIYVISNYHIDDFVEKFKRELKG